MATSVESSQTEDSQPSSDRPIPVCLLNVGLKKLFLIPVIYALVFALINGPNQDGLAKGGIYGALIAGSGLSAAMLVAKNIREVLSIFTGVLVGTIVGLPGIGSISPCCSSGTVEVILFGAFVGWLATRAYRPKRPRTTSKLNENYEL